MASVYCVLNQVIILIRKKCSRTFIRSTKQKTAQKSLLGSPQLGGHNWSSCLFPSLAGLTKIWAPSLWDWLLILPGMEVWGAFRVCFFPWAVESSVGIQGNRKGITNPVAILCWPHAHEDRRQQSSTRPVPGICPTQSSPLTQCSCSGRESNRDTASETPAEILAVATQNHVILEWRK